MLKLQSRQEGVTVLVGVLIIAVIAVVGVVALKTSDAYRLKKRTAKPFPTYNMPTQSSTQNTGSQATCSSSSGGSTQVTGTGSASVSCSSPSTSGTPGVNNTNVYTNQGANGANGTASCTVNGQPVAC